MCIRDRRIAAWKVFSQDVVFDSYGVLLTLLFLPQNIKRLFIGELTTLRLSLIHILVRFTVLMALFWSTDWMCMVTIWLESMSRKSFKSWSLMSDAVMLRKLAAQKLSLIHIWVSLQIGRRSAFIEFDYVRRQTPP